MNTIVNPFTLLNKQNLASTSSTDDLKSESAVCNDIPGRCPKCSSPMDTTIIGYVNASSKQEEIFWCADCRVATPKPEA